MKHEELPQVQSWVDQYRQAAGKTERDRIRYQAARDLTYTAWLVFNIQVTKIENHRYRYPGISST